jgi:predicted transcriptional regulator
MQKSEPTYLTEAMQRYIEAFWSVGNKPMTAIELSPIVNIAAPMASTYLRKLEAHGIVKRVGVDDSHKGGQNRTIFQLDTKAASQVMSKGLRPKQPVVPDVVREPPKPRSPWNDLHWLIAGRGNHRNYWSRLNGD